jgi:hypothetical protein
MFKNKNKKSGTHNIRVPGIMGTHNILQLFFYGSTRMFRNFISHNQTHKKPPSEPIIFSRWVPIKNFCEILWGCNISGTSVALNLCMVLVFYILVY